MTKEELKNIVRYIFHFYDVNAENCNWTDINEACGEILKILEQEPMRDATPEELKSVNDYIKSINKPTGVKFDFDEEQEQIDFIQPHKTIEKLISINVLDKISKEIDELRNYSYPFSDMLLDDVQKIIDKYRGAEV